MTTVDSTLASFYRGWQEFQDHLAQALTPLSADQLTLAAPNERTIEEIATHIIAVRARWYHDVAGAGSEDIAPIGTWDRENMPVRSTEELIDGLHKTWQLMAEALERWTTADLEEVIFEKSHGKEVTFTRQWIVWHVIEHDIYHGGEISMLLGMHGLAALGI